MSMNTISKLANPFCLATVVVANEYVDTFPHPQGLLTYLQRLFEQLEVDIVSMDRPVTVKGSWTTIIKIDAFLKTLISTLHSAISKGAVPSEEDFSLVFTHFDAENNLRTEPVENNERIFSSSTEENEIHEKVPSALESVEEKIQTVEETSEANVDRSINRTIQLSLNKNHDFDQNTHNKWYFNANPRGKTVDKSRKRYLGLEKAPPEPYVFVGGDETNKINQPDLTEIEKELCKVYKKETIEKYQKKPLHDCDRVKGNERGSDEHGTVKVEAVDLEVLSPETNHMLSSNNEKLEMPHGSRVRLKINEEKGGALYRKIKTRSEKKKQKVGNGENLHTSDASIEHKRNDAGKGKVDETFVERLPVKRKQPTRRAVSKRGNALPIHSNKVPKKGSVKEMEDRRKTQRDTKSKNILQIKEKKPSKKKKPGKHCNGVDLETESFKSKISGNFQKSTKNEEKKKNLKKTWKRNHKKQESVDTRYECDKCSYTTSKRLQLEEHMRRVHLTKSYQCVECLKEFGYQKDLKRHMKCHTKAENCCDVCGKMYKEVRKLIEHKKIHAENYVKPEFPCNFCPKSFSTKYVLAYHIKSEHLGMKRSYVCPTCGKSFSQKNSYLLHANVHLGIKPFTCEVCGKCFSYEKSLKEHKFMHKDDKVFSCKVCDKSFRQASGLTIHLKIHKATKDYVCSMCGKGFSQKQALIRHERIHAGEKPYECGLCKRTFADSSVLRRHMILIHKKDPKHWREDTLNHIPKKNDFFISVLDGGEKEKANSKDLMENENQNVHTQHLQQPEVYEQKLQIHEDGYECQLQKNSNFEQQNQQHGQSSEVNLAVVTVNPELGESESAAVPKQRASFTELKDPVDAAKSNKTTFISQKVCVDLSDSDTSINVSNSGDPCLSEEQLEPSVFSEPLQVQSQNLQSSTSLSLTSLSASGHSLESLPPQHAPSLAGHLETQLPAAEDNTTTFLPVTYQPRSFSYNTNNLQTAEMQQLQYTTVVSQPYGQTIVVLQENLGTIFHQPNVGIGMSGDTAQQSLQLQSISQSPVSPLSSSPLPHLVDLSQVVSSTPSSFGTVMTEDHQEQD